MNNLNCESYAIKHKSEDVLMKVQSGGAFFALARNVLEKNGVIYGVVLSDSYKVQHQRVTNFQDLNLLHGSKYVQSDVGDCFNKVIEDLKNDKYVLFSGTPCQVSGLKKLVEYKKIKNEKLILVDIVCHGVPSPGIWDDFVEYLKIKYGKIDKLIIRDKSFGWKSSNTTFICNGKKYLNNSFLTLYYLHYIVRPSCFDCKFRNLQRPGDVTIGDCWGIEKKDHSFFDKNGVSLFIVNSEKGQKIFDEIKNDFNYKKINISEFLQPALRENYLIPKNIEKFDNDYRVKSFDYIARKYGGRNFYTYVKKKIKKIVKK